MYALRPQIIDFNEVWGDLRRSVVNIIELQPITRIDWNHKFKYSLFFDLFKWIDILVMCTTSVLLFLIPSVIGYIVLSSVALKIM